VEKPAATRWLARLADLKAQLGQNNKLVRFALLGAAGCLLGALLGEMLLAATRPIPIYQAVCLLIDCSTSMRQGAVAGDVGRDKMSEVKRAADRFVARQNLEDNKLALVSFGSVATPLASLGADKPALARSIGMLFANGGTAMDVGLQAAQLELANLPDALKKATLVRNILLFTDGMPNDPVQTLAAAGACRAANTRIVAIVTGDADMGYLTQVTGDPALVFRADSGNFEHGFQQAEKAIYGGSLVESGPSGAGFGRSFLQISGWSALIAWGTAMALIIGQNLYLRRAPATGRELLTGTLGGLGAGLAGGAAGQLLFTMALAAANLPVVGPFLGWILIPAGKIVGWAVLGSLLGLGLSLFVPNLQPRRALVGGALGGAAAAVAFGFASLLGDVAGRFLGAAILGAVIGMMIAMVEAAFRDFWLEVRYGAKESIQVTLGETPVRIGSDNRACTVYARGARPLALHYQLVNGQVMCTDYATEQSTAVLAGDEKTVGNVTVQVCASRQARPAGESPATAPLRAAPPPPQRKPAHAPPANSPPAKPAIGSPAPAKPPAAGGSPPVGGAPPPPPAKVKLPPGAPSQQTLRPGPPPPPSKRSN
jgi:Ca-activated chloride channel family protein